jgi:hypothetical protein
VFRCITPKITTVEVAIMAPEATGRHGLLLRCFASIKIAIATILRFSESKMTPLPPTSAQQFPEPIEDRRIHLRHLLYSLPASTAKGSSRNISTNCLFCAEQRPSMAR